MLFIVIHQVYELWFKAGPARARPLQAPSRRATTPARSAHAQAILTILKVLVSQLDVLETMTPLEFSRSASGWTRERLRVGQFRALEFALGRKRTARPPASRGEPGAPLEARWAADDLGRLPGTSSSREGYPATGAARARPTAAHRADPASRTCWSTVYPTRPAQRAAVRALRRPRRGAPGVAVPARQDGRAHHRVQGGHGAARRGRVPANDARRSRSFRTSGRSASQL
jgi:tryptophan 2,3-dioxygenase